MKFLTVKEKLVLVLSEWSPVGVRSLGYLDSVGYIFSSMQSLSRVWHFETSWTAAHQASLSITNSRSLLKFMSIEAVMPSNQLILCRPLLLLPSVFPSIRVFSNESVLRQRPPGFGFSMSCTQVSPAFSSLVLGQERVLWMIALG